MPFSIAIALVLAVLLNRKIKGRFIYRAIYFMPMVAAPAAVAMVWGWLYNTRLGLLNHLLGHLSMIFYAKWQNFDISKLRCKCGNKDKVFYG